MLGERRGAGWGGGDALPGLQPPNRSAGRRSCDHLYVFLGISEQE